MGDKLGGIFYELRNQVIILHWNWSEYVELFGSKPERVDILNKAAGSFFYLVQRVLFSDTLLHICKLTDRTKTNGKSNLGICLLSDLVDHKMARRVEKLVQRALDRSEFAKDLRNRLLSHFDLDVALGTAVKPLAPANLAHVRKVIAALCELINYVDIKYCGSTFSFDLVDYRGSAKSLISVLREGINADTMRRERIRSGEETNDDVIPPGGV
jgi:hypothetical protein